MQFVGTHLPGFITDSGQDAELAAWALAFIGLFNVIGTLAAGWLGGRYRKKYLLSLLYLLRALLFFAFIQLPITETSVLVFAAIMGLLWLSTVPLTSGIVAQIFGPRYMGTLFSIVFLSHQLGSFCGGLAGRHVLRPHRELRGCVVARHRARHRGGADPLADQRQAGREDGARTRRLISPGTSLAGSGERV